MNPKDSLPIILVSASDRTTAETFISELVDNEAEVGNEKDGEDKGRVWRLVNKYYRADVMVTACGEGDKLPVSTEAHVAYFTPQECSLAPERVIEVAERRAVRGAAVRVLALRAARVPPALLTWAQRARYEPVPLLEPASLGPFAEAAGAERVRAALHAHPWRGLRRLDRTTPGCPLLPSRGARSARIATAEGLYVASGCRGPLTLGARMHRTSCTIDSDDDSSSGGSVTDGEEAEEAAVERAEQFARALGALGDGAAAGAVGDAERLERAEQLVAAFCRALGHDLDAC